MTVDAAYTLYQTQATPETLNTLFESITLYATRLASTNFAPADRDDAAQEAVVYVWRHLAKFDAKRGRFASWVLAKTLASFSSYKRAKSAQKRGAGFQMVSLLPEDVDAAYPA